MKHQRLLVSLLTAGLVAGWLFIAAGPLPAQWEVGRHFAAPAAPEVVTIYTAKKILTMERGNPEATASRYARGLPLRSDATRGRGLDDQPVI